MTKYSIRDASHFGKNYGLQVGSSVSWQKVTVSVKTLRNIKFKQLICNNNAPMTLYNAFITTNSTSLNPSAMVVRFIGKGQLASWVVGIPEKLIRRIL